MLDLIITSDASLQGWGAACKETRTGESWSKESHTCINLLELKAAFLALTSIRVTEEQSSARLASVTAASERGVQIMDAAGWGRLSTF